MQLTIQQTQELLRLIDKNQLIIIGNELGSDFFTDVDRKLLSSYGINPDALFSPENSSITTSFHFGMLSEALGQMVASKITYPELKKYIQDGEYIKLSAGREAALNSIKMETFASVKNLNGRIFNDVNHIIVDQSLAGQQEFLAKELREGILKRKSVSQIARDIARKTGDWGRDFDRIIATESQNAFERGKAEEIKRRNPNTDPLVYKVPQQGACKHCIRLYSPNGIGTEPLLFRLSELIKNGTNVGRKVAKWKAVVGTTHPYCRCPLYEAKEHHLWNPKTRKFDLVTAERKAKTERIRKLIKVHVGNNEYDV